MKTLLCALLLSGSLLLAQDNAYCQHQPTRWERFQRSGDNARLARLAVLTAITY